MTDTATIEPTISRQDLRKKLGVSSETMRQWLKSGRLPPPDVNLSRRTQAWKHSTLKGAGIDMWASV